MRWLRAVDGSRIVKDVKQSLRCLSSSTCGYTTQQRMRCVACGKLGGSGPFALRPGSSTRGSLRGAQSSATRLRSGVVASRDALTRRSRQPSSLVWGHVSTVRVSRVRSFFFRCGFLRLYTRYCRHRVEKSSFLLSQLINVIHVHVHVSLIPSQSPVPLDSRERVSDTLGTQARRRAEARALRSLPRAVVP